MLLQLQHCIYKILQTQLYSQKQTDSTQNITARFILNISVDIVFTLH